MNNIKDSYQVELDKILKNCELCHAKLCFFCNNGKRKKILKEKIKKLK